MRREYRTSGMWVKKRNTQYAVVIPDGGFRRKEPEAGI
jgi:hypothetical protein